MDTISLALTVVLSFGLGVVTIGVFAAAYAAYHQYKLNKQLEGDAQANQKAHNILVDHVEQLTIELSKVQPLQRGEERLAQLEKRVDDLTTQNAFGKNFIA